ncbi:hypothetical protein MMC14_000233 [Varicellaria rhodocarpa]|nr:hypothetical protein [Varicellaria rhodocarpa]
MAHSEKDFSSGHNGTLNHSFPSPKTGSDESHHSGTINSSFSNHANGTYLNEDVSSEQALRRMRTAGSISLSPELFEKLYLSPESKVKGELRKTFGNPTPLALLGFLLSLTPLSCDLMGWRGAGGGVVGAAGIGTYYWFGGLLMFVGGLLEFFLGNTFPFVVFCSFGAFWFSFGSTLTPSFGAFADYSPTDPSSGLSSPAFAAAFGFFLLFMGLLCFIYFICSLRTNLTFVTIFLMLLMTFVLLASTYFNLAMGNAVMAGNLLITSGAVAFVACLAGWWIFLAQMLASVDFPIQLPVGDISHLIKGASEKKRKQHSSV